MESIKNLFVKNSPEKIGYIEALDGLRAVAVILVMLLHAHFQLGKGGTLGVDIFFALSGFLITTLLLEEYRDNGRVSLGGFYIRRTFRLFPALYFMLLIIWLYAVFFAQSFSKLIILKEIFFSGIYVYNISYLWGCKSLILGHTWSLAVEEQFYFIWPFTLVLLLRFWKVHKLLIGLLFFIPMAWVFKTLNVIPVLHGLIYESLFIGCLFALLRWTGKLPKIPNFITTSFFLILLLVGLFPTAAYKFIFQNDLRGIAGLISVFVILGLVENKDSIISKVLSSKIFVFFGKISYALYLWHVPVFRWFLWHSTLPPFVAFILKFVVTFILAVVSYELIEKKSIKMGRRLSNKLLFKSVRAEESV